MSSTTDSSAAAQSVSHYTRRAQNYDSGNSQWHVSLGQQFVEDANPLCGSRCLDLACGTGLVTFPLAEAVGTTGHVIGIDITPAMLDIAKSQPRKPDWAPIDFIEHDIAHLDGIAQIQSVIAQHGGFDLIACCSALILLSDPAAAIQSWAKLLKPGGKLIADVPTEDHLLQYILSWDLRGATASSIDPSRPWVKGIDSLNKLCTDAGLVIERSWRADGLPEQQTEYGLDEGDRVFGDCVQKYSDFMDPGKIDETKGAFLQMWAQRCERNDGCFRDGPWLYVTIARKR